MKNVIVLLFCLICFINISNASETTIIIEEISLSHKETLLNDIINTPIDNDFYYMTNYKPLSLLSQKDVNEACNKNNQTISLTTKSPEIVQNITKIY